MKIGLEEKVEVIPDYSSIQNQERIIKAQEICDQIDKLKEELKKLNKDEDIYPNQAEGLAQMFSGLNNGNVQANNIIETFKRAGEKYLYGKT